MQTIDLYVAPNGDDNSDGQTPESAGQSGPLATLDRAFALLAERRRRGELPGTARILMRGGTYRVTCPIVLTPRHSMPVTVMPYEGEQPVISGGSVITDWTETVHNGRRAWVTTVEDVRAGHWFFRSLYVNDRRRDRPRLPKQGMFRMTEVPGMALPSGWSREGFDRFKIGPDEMRDYRNLTDIDVLAFHFWICERMPVAAFDAETGLITTAVRSRAPLVEAWGHTLAPCMLENVYEALTEPGEWYLSRQDGKLTYLPLDGETLENTFIVAPRVLQLLKIKGYPERGERVEWIRFRDIAFRHTDWSGPRDPRVEADTAWHDPARGVYRRARHGTGSASQAENDLSGVIFLRGARNCTFEGCTIANTGWYGLEVGDGCHGIALRGCELADLGAGGVKLNGAAYDEYRPDLETGNTVIMDCHIHHGGHVFCAAIGVLCMHSFGNRICHNEIHNFYYSGISLGWQWNFAPSVCRDNLVAFNHIHHLGFGRLSDMGGIYTLGIQSGTVLRNNYIHDIEAMNYGAWCIYPDEGSSHLLIENNVCHTTNREIFHQHYGRANIVRNNIFAFGERALVTYSCYVEPELGFRLYRNVLLARNEAHFLGGYAVGLDTHGHESDFNLLWRTDGETPWFTTKADTTADAAGGVPFAEWQRLGHDRQSIVVDPGCADPDSLDFTLASDSPAIERLGFEPIDLRAVGPRPRERWHNYAPPHARAIKGMP